MAGSDGQVVEVCGQSFSRETDSANGHRSKVERPKTVLGRVNENQVSS
jgi:hypothetical protein